MNIGEAGKLSGLSPDTIRFYEKRGLILSIKRDKNGHRYYAESDLDWLGMLACLRGTGMPLAETETFTRLVQEGDHTVHERIKLLESHRKRLEQKRAELTQFEKHLDEKISYYNNFLKTEEKKKAQ